MGLSVFAVIVFGILNWHPFFPKQTYLIPEGVEGDVYIFRGVVRGEKIEKQGDDLTFRIPSSRFLLSQYVPDESAYIPNYFYVKADGTQIPLEFEPSSLHNTEENRNNQSPFVWFPRESSSNWATVPCEVRYEQFYVGTRPHMLKLTQKDRDDEYFRFKAFVEANADRICEGAPKSKSVILKNPGVE